MFKSVLIPLILLIPITTSATEQVDPMRPDGYAATMAPGKTTATASKKPSRAKLRLQSIRISSAESHATINGKLLKVGSKIGRAQLIAIEHNQVKLRKNGEQITLMFLPLSIKR